MSTRIRAFVRAGVLLAMAAVCSRSAFCATVTWDAGGGDGNWSNPLNWSGDSLPTSSDDVVIDNSTSVDTVLLDQNATVKSIDIGNGVTFHVGAGELLTVNGPSVSTVAAGGTLQLDGATPSGGSFTGNGDLTVSGVVHVYGNSPLGGRRALTINNGGDVQVGTAVLGWVMSISRNTTNNTGGKLTFLINSFGDTTLTGSIANSGDIEFQSDRNLNGSAVLNNNSGGVIKKTTTTGITAINFAVNNSAGATVDVQTGTLDLNGGGSDSGIYSISSGTRSE